MSDAAERTPPMDEPPLAAERAAPAAYAPRSPNDVLRPVEPPPKPPRVRREHGAFVVYGNAILSILLVAALAALIGAGYATHRLSAPGPLQDERAVLLRGGAGEIGEELTRQGVVSEPYLFGATVKLLGLDRSLKAGEYLFRPGVSVREVVEALVEGRAILHMVTIPEGLTSAQIVQRLRDSDVLVGEVRTVPPEGSLLPESYKVSRGDSREGVLRRMEKDAAAARDQAWRRRSPDVPVRSPAELVTLASIVEKETGRADERPRVAGVFINRLKRGMRLQSDPTVVYGIAGGAGTLGRPISRDDLTRPTAYNTYTIEGLPPSPIANPGRAALEAVANPSRTRDLYFVADGTGGHAFSETLDGHNRNVQRWRQIEAARRDAPADQPSPLIDKPVPEAQPQQLLPQRRGEVPSLRAVPASPEAAALPAEADALVDERGGALQTYPVAPGRRANLPAAGRGVPPLADAPEPGAPRPRGFDAVEGTVKDPLLNRSYDLSTPKTVPRLR